MYKMSLRLPCTIFLVFCIAVINFSEGKVRPCEEKENALALLDISKDSLIKAKEIIHGCNEDNPVNNTECGLKEKSIAFIDVALNLVDEARDSYPDCNSKNVVDPDEKDTKEDKVLAVDCLQVMELGNKKSGIYPIQLFNSTASMNQSVKVFCDMDTDGGGWTVIQRRGNFSVQEDFNRDWESYKKGFGSINKDFWIGNEMIHILTNEGSNNLRFDLGDVNGEKAYAIYKDFNIANENHGYKLSIGTYSGNAGDSFAYSNGLKFSTEDRINDGDSYCPTSQKGAWWFKSCSRCNPNSFYNPGEKTGFNIFWYDWRYHEGLAFSEMKIRRSIK